MQLLLIRHGETLWNREGRIQGTSDIELSETGIRQAEKLAWSLRTPRSAPSMPAPSKGRTGPLKSSTGITEKKSPCIPA